MVEKCENGLRLIQKDSGFYIFVNDTQNGPFEYVLFGKKSDQVGLIERAFDCFSPVGVGTKASGEIAWTFIGLDGKVLISPPPFSKITPFVDGFANGYIGNCSIMKQTIVVIVDQVGDIKSSKIENCQ